MADLLPNGFISMVLCVVNPESSDITFVVPAHSTICPPVHHSYRGLPDEFLNSLRPCGRPGHRTRKRLSDSNVILFRGNVCSAIVTGKTVGPGGDFTKDVSGGRSITVPAHA